MQVELFKIMAHQFPVVDWSEKKKEIVEKIDFTKLIRKDKQGFLSDRETNNNAYAEAFMHLFQNELQMFRNEVNHFSFDLTSVWTAEYHKGDWHPPHTHGATGYSGILYLDFDMDEHGPTYFINPFTDPNLGDTIIRFPLAMEGVLTIVPSALLHFTYPNESDKVRRIIGFDLKNIQ
jgi:hypothetical protein